ncbi:migration and invasion enhancer 1-like [Ruditapes philippinarum]|uniref:migration and invasion enhancer 1-like n=1 Tax=Ruditapes philippinarum TaxID=129788 RepID=UPI00295ABF46|nr:migration and invasion enhancer 1-like [Ruditapes philippinarum]
MEDILTALPETEVSGEVGRSSCFEVTVNGQLIFSKLKLHGFPKSENVIKEIERLMNGGKCQEITDAESPGCTIL